MLRIREVLVALPDPGRAAEVVDRDGRDALLAEPQGELLVEVVQATNVGKNDDAAPSRRIGPAANAANRVPSAASSTRSSCETDAPAIGGIGGPESGS